MKTAIALVDEDEEDKEKAKTLTTVSESVELPTSVVSFYILILASNKYIFYFLGIKVRGR